MNNDRESGRPILELDGIPVSEGTLLIGSSFMLSDNLNETEPIDIFNILGTSKIRPGVPFKLKFTVILLCVSGSMKIRLSMKQHEVCRGDLLFVLDGMVAECLEMSGDSKLIMIAFSEGFNIIDTRLRPSAEMINSISASPLIRLSDDEYRAVATLYGMMKSRLADPRFPAAEELAVNCVRTIFCYVSDSFNRHDAKIWSAVSRRREIFDSFLDLIDRFGSSYHKLDFYADRLFITAKYMSKVVQEESGRSAREWIILRLILEAKALLGEYDLSVLQISERMEFPNQSFFGAFFKRFTGMTPGQYRKSLM